VHETVNTVAGGSPCWTVIVALVNERSVIATLPFPGHSRAPGIGVVGGLVVTVKVALPFLSSTCVPETESGAGFRGGNRWRPDRSVHVVVTLAVALKLTTMSSAPKPAKAPLAVSVSPLSVKKGELSGGCKCTFWADAATPKNATPAPKRTTVFNRRTRNRATIEIDIASSLFSSNTGPCGGLAVNVKAARPQYPYESAKRALRG
jgi:hypothetical protein